MKIAILSDIHGNLQALQSVFSTIDLMDIREIICLGDIVGYGANPNECIELIQSRKIPSVVGNHDKAVIGEIPIENFSEAARRGVLWTQSVISPANKNFLASLNFSIKEYDTLFVHGSPDSPENFRYLFDQEDAAESFHAFTEQICYIGHTHRPEIFCEDGITDQLMLDKRYIVNVGSVGQPRDGDRRSCFVVYDTEQFTANFIRVEYDIEKARTNILEAGLPQKLADRLLIGV